MPGELPPPPPRAFFGRDELIEKVVDSTKQLAPVALIGAGGIGKTSIILTVLHDGRIKQRFGNNRWFIRCDEFPASRPNFLRRLSEVIGAGVENPEDLTSLRRYLSSKEMLIILDNAESVLDLQESSTQDIYTVVDELTRFNNVCICITSRISTIPPDCEIIEIPTLSVDAARNTFCRIYKHDQQSGPIDDILRQLDFHPLSISLLATVAQHNKWDTDRITGEWGRQRTGLLRIQPSRSFAATIELSLTSPMFRELGPDARGLLGVIAFFPQGVNEKNVDWLFPTIPDGSNMLDKFCVLSLTYRTNGFVTMLAPLRDYLCPKDPMTSPLLRTTKERYFARLSTSVFPGEPGFEGSRWIVSEDVNVEYLLDVFTSIDAGSEDVWGACSGFIMHLYWHKPRLIMLGPKIEALPDDHPSKPEYLWDLSWLFDSVGNVVERKRLLTHGLKLGREREDNYWVAKILGDLSDANRQMGLPGEGIPQAKEASEIFEQLGYTEKQADALIHLAWLLHDDGQSNAAEEPVSRAIDLLPEEGGEHLACQGHRLLGMVYGSNGDLEKAIHHSEISLGLATSLNVAHELFWTHHSLADLYSNEGRFDDAHTHLKHAKSHAVNDVYLLAQASWMEAWCFKEQQMLEGAKLEALSALRTFEKLGATAGAERTEELLEEINDMFQKEDNPDASGELFRNTLLVVYVNSFCFRRDFGVRMKTPTFASGSSVVTLSQVTTSRLFIPSSVEFPSLYPILPPAARTHHPLSFSPTRTQPVLCFSCYLVYVRPSHKLSVTICMGRGR